MCIDKYFRVIHLVVLAFAVALMTAAAKAEEKKAPLKVGWLLSEYTGTGPHWPEKPYGYADMARVGKMLISPDVELVPVIEPGSEKIYAIQTILRRDVPKTKAKLITDKEAMAQIDVFVMGEIPNATPEVLDTIEARVKEGAGLVIQLSFGAVTPGYTAQVLALNGLKEGQHTFRPPRQECHVIAEHPLLRGLKPGQAMTFPARGPYGVLVDGSQPLIALDDPSAVSPIGPNAQQRDDFVFFPLYLSKLGKGPIVVCAFPCTEPLPKELEPAGKRFIVRCVKWAAGRELD